MRLLERLDSLDDRTTRRPVVRLSAIIVIALLVGWNVILSAADGDWVRAAVITPIGVLIVGAVIAATGPRTVPGSREEQPPD